MQPAADRLAAVLEGVDFRPPAFPVLSNVTGRPHGAPAEIRAAMVRQVTAPVRFVACVQTLQGLGVDRYVECGPGRVLTGLVKRIDKQGALHNITDLPTLQAAVEKLGI